MNNELKDKPGLNRHIVGAQKALLPRKRLWAF
jgi:hypothetical protein